MGVCGCVCVRASVAHRCLPTVRRRVGHAVVAEEAAYYSTAVVYLGRLIGVCPVPMSRSFLRFIPIGSGLFINKDYPYLLGTW